MADFSENEKLQKLELDSGENVVDESALSPAKENMESPFQDASASSNPASETLSETSTTLGNVDLPSRSIPIPTPSSTPIIIPAPMAATPAPISPIRPIVSSPIKPIGAAPVKPILPPVKSMTPLPPAGMPPIPGSGASAPVMAPVRSVIVPAIVENESEIEELPQAPAAVPRPPMATAAAPTPNPGKPPGVKATGVKPQSASPRSSGASSAPLPPRPRGSNDQLLTILSGLAALVSVLTAAYMALSYCQLIK